MLKLDYIYLSVGVITMILNIATILHFIGRGGQGKDTGSPSYDEIITFRLSGAGRSETGYTQQEPMDETKTLQ